MTRVRVAVAGKACTWLVMERAGAYHAWLFRHVTGVAAVGCKVTSA